MSTSADPKRVGARALPLLLLAACTSPPPSPAAATPPPVAPAGPTVFAQRKEGFEAADLESLGWKAASPGYAAVVDPGAARGGARSLRIAQTGEGRFGAASLRMAVGAAAGHRARLTGWVKAEEVRGQASLWLRVEGQAGELLVLDVMEGEGVEGTADWRALQIDLRIPPEATQIVFGGLVIGSGTAWFDDLELTLLERQRVTVSGVVHDPDGGVVADAVVAAVTTAEPPQLPDPPTITRTNRAGRFHFELFVDRYAFTATAPGWAATYEAPRHVEAEREIDLTLGRDGIHLRGTLRKEGGDTIAGAQLSALRFSSDKGDAFFAFTDGDGRFDMELPVAPRYWLRVDERGPVSAQVVVEGKADHTLALVEQEAAPETVVAWIRDHAEVLAGADPSLPEDDLAPLLTMISDAAVVALGEATHGTREFFQLKHRLFARLVAAGFEVFAIEASFPEAEAVNDYVIRGEGDPRAAIHGLHFWSWDTEEVLSLVEWMRAYNADPKHPRKLRFYGVDMQFPALAAQRALAYVAERDRGLADALKVPLAPLLGDPSDGRIYDRLDEPARAAIGKAIDELLAAFEREGSRWSRDREAYALAHQHARVLAQAHAWCLHHDAAARDRAMADNLEWVRTRERGARVVFWAHNGHIQRKGPAGEPKATGEHLADALGDDYVALGFAFHQGSFRAFQRNQVREVTVAPSPAASVDAALARTGLHHFLLDLRAAPTDVRGWLATPRPIRELGSTYVDERFAFQTSSLTDRFDLLVFVASTTSARPLQR